MGSGKTAVGRTLARRLRREFVDLDAAVEAAAGASVADIFAREGEAGFRAREAAAVATTAERPGLVVACGGGVVLDPANVAVLRGCGTVVWLQVSPAVAARRVGGDATRPVLAAMPGDLAERLAVLMAQREGAYRAAADAVVDAEGSTAEVADRVAAAVGDPVASPA